MADYTIQYYQQINEEEAEQAERLADILMWKYAPSSVLDIGCATGLYLKPFWVSGMRVRGVDYSESVIEDEVLQIPRKFIFIKDITREAIKEKADLTICIEVMEHIENAAAIKALNTIVKTSNLIFFTAAQPGQGGVGHINCQPKEYWEALFKKKGFQRDFKDEHYIRTLMANGYHMGWLTNNMMIFKRK